MCLLHPPFYIITTNNITTIIITTKIQEAGVLPEYKSYESFAHYLQPPTSLHARAHVLLLPKNLLPMHPQLIPELLQVSRALRADAVFGPQGIVLVHWQRYYAAVQTHLPTFRAHRFSLALLKQVLKHAGLTVQDVPVQVWWWE